MLRVWPWPKTQSKTPPKQALKTCLARTTEYEKEKKKVLSCLPRNLHLEYTRDYISYSPFHLPPVCIHFNNCYLLLCCKWIPSRALLSSSSSSSLLSYCDCEALRARARRGALEVFFIIIIITPWTLNLWTVQSHTRSASCYATVSSVWQPFARAAMTLDRSGSGAEEEAVADGDSTIIRPWRGF